MDTFNGIHPPERKKIGLVRAAGQFIPYNGESPEIFSQPLVISGNGSIEGVESGGRSAITGRYKLKGCIPEEGKNYDGEPFGGMSPKKCLNELGSSKSVSDKYEEYGFNAPLAPLGRFEYEMQFNGCPVSCAVLKCNGDTRISEAEVKLLSLPKRHPELWNHEYLDAVLSGIAAWTGFNHREITQVPGVVFDVKIAKDFGFLYREIRRGSRKGKDIKLAVSNSEREWKEGNKNEIILHVNEKRFDWQNNIRKTYLKFTEGTDIPEPINEKIIQALFC